MKIAYPDYPAELISAAVGQKFRMLNYGEDIYMRCGEGLHTIQADGYIPVVNIADGHSFHMSKLKPIKFVTKIETVTYIQNQITKPPEQLYFPAI